MKIALACRVYPTHRPGGMPFVCQDRARALASLGHEVHVLTTGLNGHRGETVIDEGVEVHHMPCKPEVNSDEFAGYCTDHCLGWLPDVAHSDSFDIHRPWICMNGIAKVRAITPHGFFWGSWFTQMNLHLYRGATKPKMDRDALLREQMILKGVDRVIGISVREHKMLSELMELPTCRLVFNPIPEFFFRDPRPPNGSQRRRFLTAAISGQGTRGWDIAEKAAALAGVELVQMQSMARDAMPAVYDNVDGYVLPTFYAQGSDLTVDESLARLRPVIASATGSYEAMASHRPSVVLVQPGDVHGFAQAMTGTLPTVQAFESAANRPEVHARNWLEAMGL